MAGYAAWSHRRSAGTGPAPAVSFELLRSARWSATLLLTCVASVVLFAMLFLAPVFLQQVQRHSATVTGLALLPQGVIMGFASALGNVIVGAQVRAAMVYSIVAAGLALLGASTLGLLLLTAASPVWLTAVLLCGRGVALGITVQLLVRGLLGGLDAAQSPDANTLFNIGERLSGSFGIAFLATFYASRAQASGSPVTALHDCAIALTAACAAGALGALSLAAAETRVRR
jgi:predicted MFS family arabinose efflux permease